MCICIHVCEYACICMGNGHTPTSQWTAFFLRPGREEEQLLETPHGTASWFEKRLPVQHVKLGISKQGIAKPSSKKS